MKHWYILQYKESGKFVAIDMGSGGYPYEVDDPNSVKFFRTYKEALDYSEMFKDQFYIVTVTPFGLVE